MSKFRMDAIDKIFHMLEDPRYLYKAFTTGKFSAASYVMCSRLTKVIEAPELIIDVGANVGQFSSCASIFFPKSKIDAFEPIPECFNILVKNTSAIKEINSYNFAIGDKDSSISFYVNAESQSSSALPTSDLRLKIFPNAYAEEEIVVEQRSLESFYKNSSIGKNALLKIDVQGLEEKVLMGSQDILKNIRYILLEASVNPMYEGELTLPEMIKYTESLGYSLISITTASRSPISKNYIEFDLLFENKT